MELLLWVKNEFVDFFCSSTVWIPNSWNCLKKEAITIDEWVKRNNINKLDFIKMDIEGAEIEALYGCEETIKTSQPNFVIASYHSVNNEHTFIKVEEFFSSKNYPFKTLKFRGSEFITFAGVDLN